MLVSNKANAVVVAKTSVEVTPKVSASDENLPSLVSVQNLIQSGQWDTAERMLHSLKPDTHHSVALNSQSTSILKVSAPTQYRFLQAHITSKRPFLLALDGNEAPSDPNKLMHLLRQRLYPHATTPPTNVKSRPAVLSSKESIPYIEGSTKSLDSYSDPVKSAVDILSHAIQASISGSVNPRPDMWTCIRASIHLLDIIGPELHKPDHPYTTDLIKMCLVLDGVESPDFIPWLGIYHLFLASVHLNSHSATSTSGNVPSEANKHLEKALTYLRMNAETKYLLKEIVYLVITHNIKFPILEKTVRNLSFQTYYKIQLMLNGLVPEEAVLENIKFCEKAICHVLLSQQELSYHLSHSADAEALAAETRDYDIDTCRSGLDLARIAIERNNFRLAETLLSVVGQVPVDSSNYIQQQILVAKINVKRHPKNDVPLEDRQKALQILKTVIPMGVKGKFRNATQEACTDIWNYAYPILKAENRKFLTEFFRSAVDALKELDSQIPRLRIRLHLELAICYEYQDMYTFATSNIKKALQFCKDDQKLKDYILFVEHRLFVKQSPFVEKYSIETQALSLIDMGNSMQDTTESFHYLDKALTKLVTEDEIILYDFDVAEVDLFTFSFPEEYSEDLEMRKRHLSVMGSLLSAARSCTVASQTEPNLTHSSWYLLLRTACHILNQPWGLPEDDETVIELMAEAYLARGQSILEVFQADFVSKPAYFTRMCRHVIDSLFSAVQMGAKLKKYWYLHNALNSLVNFFTKYCPWPYIPETHQSPIASQSEIDSVPLSPHVSLLEWAGYLERAWNIVEQHELNHGSLAVNIALCYGRAITDMEHAASANAMNSPVEDKIAKKVGPAGAIPNSATVGKLQAVPASPTPSNSARLKRADEYFRAVLKHSCSHSTKISFVDMWAKVQLALNESFEVPSEEMSEGPLKLFLDLKVLELNGKGDKVSDLAVVNMMKLMDSVEGLEPHCRIELWTRIINCALQSRLLNLTFQCVQIAKREPEEHKSKLALQYQFSAFLYMQQVQLLYFMVQDKILYSSPLGMYQDAIESCLSCLNYCSRLANPPLINQAITWIWNLSLFFVNGGQANSLFRLLSSAFGLLDRISRQCTELQEIPKETVFHLFELFLDICVSKSRLERGFDMFAIIERILPDFPPVWECKVKFASSIGKKLSGLALMNAPPKTQAQIWFQVASTFAEKDKKNEAFLTCLRILEEDSKQPLDLEYSLYRLHYAEWQADHGYSQDQVEKSLNVLENTPSSFMSQLRKLLLKSKMELTKAKRFLLLSQARDIVYEGIASLFREAVAHTEAMQKLEFLSPAPQAAGFQSRQKTAAMVGGKVDPKGEKKGKKGDLAIVHDVPKDPLEPPSKQIMHINWPSFVLTLFMSGKHPITEGVNNGKVLIWCLFEIASELAYLSHFHEAIIPLALAEFVATSLYGDTDADLCSALYLYHADVLRKMGREDDSKIVYDLGRNFGLDQAPAAAITSAKGTKSADIAAPAPTATVQLFGLSNDGARHGFPFSTQSVLCFKARFLMCSSEFDKAHEVLLKSRSLAEAAQDQEGISQVNIYLSLLSLLHGEEDLGKNLLADTKCPSLRTMVMYAACAIRYTRDDETRGTEQVIAQVLSKLNLSCFVTDRYFIEEEICHYFGLLARIKFKQGLPWPEVDLHFQSALQLARKHENGLQEAKILISRATLYASLMTKLNPVQKQRALKELCEQYEDIKQLLVLEEQDFDIPAIHADGIRPPSNTFSYSEVTRLRQETIVAHSSILLEIGMGHNEMLGNQNTIQEFLDTYMNDKGPAVKFSDEERAASVVAVTELESQIASMPPLLAAQAGYNLGQALYRLKENNIVSGAPVKDDLVEIAAEIEKAESEKTERHEKPEKKERPGKASDKTDNSEEGSAVESKSPEDLMMRRIKNAYFSCFYLPFALKNRVQCQEAAEKLLSFTVLGTPESFAFLAVLQRCSNNFYVESMFARQHPHLNVLGKASSIIGEAEQVDLDRVMSKRLHYIEKSNFAYARANLPFQMSFSFPSNWPKNLRVIILCHSLDKKRLYFGTVCMKIAEKGREVVEQVVSTHDVDYSKISGLLAKVDARSHPKSAGSSEVKFESSDLDILQNHLAQALDPLKVNDIKSPPHSASPKKKVPGKVGKPSDDENTTVASPHIVLLLDSDLNNLPVERVIAQVCGFTSISRDFHFDLVADRLKCLSSQPSSSDKRRDRGQANDQVVKDFPEMHSIKYVTTSGEAHEKMKVLTKDVKGDAISGKFGQPTSNELLEIVGKAHGFVFIGTKLGDMLDMFVDLKLDAKAFMYIQALNRVDNQMPVNYEDSRWIAAQLTLNAIDTIVLPIRPTRDFIEPMSRVIGAGKALGGMNRSFCQFACNILPRKEGLSGGVLLGAAPTHTSPLRHQQSDASTISTTAPPTALNAPTSSHKTSTPVTAAIGTPSTLIAYGLNVYVRW